MLRRERLIVLSAIATLIVLAWAYTVGVALQSTPMAGGMTMPAMMAWTGVDFAYMFAMWAVMMVAMMMPSATPTVLIYGTVRRRRQETGRAYAPTGAFVLGYLFVWVAVSLAATLVNWWLHAEGAMTAMMGRVAPLGGGAVLIGAGVFQYTKLKQTCLENCRTPLAFLTQNWREGTRGAFMMGAHHGAYCLGCCWMLMALLFGLGVMNIAWVAVLTVVVLAEKLLPHGAYISRALGAVLIIWGIWMAAGA